MNEKNWFADFHTHTIFSDGELLPSELVQRVHQRGCRCLALTDHADSSNLDFVLSRLLKFVEEMGRDWGIPVVPGVELTHVPPGRIEKLAYRARQMGARWVVVHGETLAEPVAPGTNRAALEAGVDLLAHPGLISAEEAASAAALGVFLEVSTRQGHSLGNGRVVKMARETGARLLLNTDSHAPRDILDAESRARIGMGAGMDSQELDMVWRNFLELAERLGGEKS